MAKSKTAGRLPQNAGGFADFRIKDTGELSVIIDTLVGHRVFFYVGPMPGGGWVLICDVANRKMVKDVQDVYRESKGGS